MRCRVGEGPHAALAEALNTLAISLDARRTRPHEPFGVEVLVAQSPIMMVTCDASERIRFMNYTVPGYLTSDVVGKSFYDFVMPDQVEMVRSHVHHLLRTGEATGYEIRSSVPIGPEWYGVKLGPIRAGEQIIGFTMSLMDITDLKRTQLRLEQSNRELENFATVASHDLQEPLRKIQTFSERLTAMCAETLSPEGRDYLERMNNAAARMRKLIDDLLTYSRVSSKSQTFLRLDLAEVAGEVLGDLETAIEQSGATVTVGELPSVDASPMQMRQLLQNLLSNALKFRRDDVAPSISISGTVDPDGRYCELKVEDNGIGFEEKYLDRIFNVFQRLHGRGKYEGTGIGLAICRRIAERHGGSISARSTPGQGSTFIVRLPRSQTSSR
ncbi:PAS domain-containing sensor histidine kinase [Archangium sp.]|uniref:PAS domain-containing sensor histidine kinase n=1 Tax=Archangium sp. TaxID=1872627 RepID=UPI002ED8B6EA